MTTRVKKQRKPAPKLSVQDKLTKLREEMNEALVERTDEVDGLLVALLAREHMLLLGPPGTAKTLMVELASKAIDGSSYFYWLMSRFTVPEELFGSFSLKALKQDKHERVTGGKLPEASIAFLDEVFKANSAILNNLLTLINERKFHNGGQALDVPLETMVGASNELPESGELDALYDRFLLRYWTSYISDRGAFKDMLMNGEPMISTTLTMAELQAAQEEADQVVITEDILDLLVEVKQAIEKAGFLCSDRRWVKCLCLLQAHAYLNGRSEVTEEDLMLLRHILWKEPKDRGELGRVIAKVANPLAHECQVILDACKETYREIPFNEQVEESRSAEVFTQVVEANGQFKQAVEKLKKLANGKRSGVVESAVDEIETMMTEAGRFAGKVSGLSI